jgi:hypothetical protein
MVVRVLVALVGGWLVLWTLSAAIKTVVLPRASSSWLTRTYFTTIRGVFDAIASPKRSFAFRDRVLAIFPPIALLALPGFWVTLVVAGFTAIFWGSGVNPLSEAFVTSGSSLLTLGFIRPHGIGRIIAAFIEAGFGLGLVSLMISYLPTIYGAFSRREALVGMLEVRAGTPPDPAVLITRYSRLNWLETMHEDLFVRWEEWFIEVEESHTSQPALAFFRSPLPERSWITAAGCVMDAAAIVESTVDRPNDARAAVMMRTGWQCLRRISDFFGIKYDADPSPDAPISVTRAQFDQMCAELELAQVPLKADRDQAWRDFAGWRVNYDAVLLQLAALIVAPPGKWSSGDVMGTRLKKARRS